MKNLAATITLGFMASCGVFLLLLAWVRLGIFVAEYFADGDMVFLLYLTFTFMWALSSMIIYENYYKD
jgi:hypothetical protein